MQVPALPWPEVWTSAVLQLLSFTEPPLTSEPDFSQPPPVQIAARMAFREGMKKAGVQLLEPIMKVSGYKQNKNSIGGERL